MNEPIIFESTVQTQIRKSIRWARVSAIVSFISLGLGLLQVVIASILGNVNLFGSILSFLVSSVISLILSLQLFQFAKKANIGLDTQDTIHFKQSFSHLKIYFILMGVLFLIIVCLLLLFLFIALIASIFSTLSK